MTATFKRKWMSYTDGIGYKLYLVLAEKACLRQAP